MTGDTTWPDLVLKRAVELDGIVVNESGQPVVGAEVYPLAVAIRGPRLGEPIHTGAGGTFHLDRLVPDGKVSLWARSGDATTDGAVVVQPDELKGRLTLTIDPRYTFRIRGMVTDQGGRRIAGAKASLRWHRPYPPEKGQRGKSSLGSPLASHMTREDGWFIFRCLWPGLTYDVSIEARGYRKADVPEVIGKAGETHDTGRIVLIN